MLENEVVNERIMSHGTKSESLDETIQKLKQRICQEGDKPYITVARQLELIDQLSQFNFGKFLLQNKGLNGYWTHYVLTHPWFGRKTRVNDQDQPFNEVEEFLLDKAPLALAGQQRFQISLQECQHSVKNGAVLASIPCGMMGELLYLDYTGIQDISLVGIDLDPQAIQDAKQLAQKMNLTKWTDYLIKDAWYLDIKNEFNLISSSGLNFYEPDENKIIELYRQFYTALQPNGVLVTSCFTIPPYVNPEKSEWDLTKIEPQVALFAKVIIVELLEHGKSVAYRSTEQTKQHLMSAGFRDVKFIFDNARIFPVIVAKK